MKVSGKIWHMIILKVKKNQGIPHSLKDTFLEKPQGGFSFLLITNLYTVFTVLTVFENKNPEIFAVFDQVLKC